MPNGKGPKRVAVLEVGAGKQPWGILGQARRALKKRNGRKFEASDVVAERNLFRAIGLYEMPRNAKILRKCSLEHLKQTKTASQDIIFGSYFLKPFFNHYNHPTRTQTQAIKQLFLEINRVLKPNGRAIFINSLIGLEEEINNIKNTGLRLHTTELKLRPDVEYPKWIEARSTKAKRKQHMEESIAHGNTTIEDIEKASKQQGKSIDELLKPHVFIIRK